MELGFVHDNMGSKITLMKLIPLQSVAR
jgi:hypothetical protein